MNMHEKYIVNQTRQVAVIRLRKEQSLGLVAGFIFFLLIFFLVGGEVVSSVVSFLINSLIDRNRISQTFMTNNVVDDLLSNRYQVLDLKIYGYSIMTIYTWLVQLIGASRYLPVNFLRLRCTDHLAFLHILNYPSLLQLNH